ncbi:MAG: bifunctional oligoribonuclease/PAP phosphatase NrnA [Candidatus Omnitrophica bacterium]|nr:bifunctional oligoribonuclease/PAP phosphatase NrnA [Candidatus Omnitrophota bacterium]
MNIKRISSAIRKSQRILITAHVSPDLDALCCELVMTDYLKSIGKKVLIANADGLPDMYQFLKGGKQIKKVQKISRQYDLVIIFDCGDLNRIGSIKDILPKNVPIVNIDHHVTNKLFGTYNLVKPKASSSAEVLFEFLMKEKFALTKNIAELLYLGILTDTGSFRYQTTTAYTHEIAARLLEFKLPVYPLYNQVYENLSESDLKIFLEAVKNFTSIEKGKILCVELKKRILLKAGERFDLRDKIFSFLRMIKNNEVIVIFTEVSSLLTKVNFRSSGRINVASIASQYAGGGHKAASGCRYPGNLKSAKKNVLALLRKQF